MMKTNISQLMMTLAAAAMLTACSNDATNMYDAGAKENDLKLDYTENFKKKYSNVDLNQSWDFSSKSFDYSLPVKSQKAITRATSYDFSTTDYYEVENGTLNWLKETLTESKDHRNLGSPFLMTVPGTEFTIVPIYQGQASAIWRLHLVVNGEDILVWSKSQDIQVKDNDNNGWHQLHCVDPRSWEMDMNTATDYTQAVRAKGYTFSNLPVGEDMYFYLEITTSGDGDFDSGDGKGFRHHYYNSVGAQQSSLKGMMLALSCPTPSNIPEGYEAMIIGCEDADLEESDWDMNDVVFLVYGQNVPKPLEITDGTPIVQTRNVRYMIEDLGATDDFDFNDIVLDVTQTITSTPILTNGIVTGVKPAQIQQKAVIRHLGGTLPFVLKIGNTQLEEHAGVLGANPDEEFEVSGWNPDTHNVTIRVRQQGNDGVFNSFGFPKAGEAPMIIAVNPSQQWMNERQSVPESWFTTPTHR